jgi:hypothetical protein
MKYSGAELMMTASPTVLEIDEDEHQSGFVSAGKDFDPSLWAREVKAARRRGRSSRVAALILGVAVAAAGAITCWLLS